MTSDSHEANDQSSDAAEPMPETVSHAVKEGRVATLDARPLLQAGKEPLGEIMNVVNRLEPGFVFKLTAPFQPRPLFNLLGQKGFSYWSKPIDSGAETWETYFYRERENEEESSEQMEELFALEDAEGQMIELDVRGLEPPEPLERVLGAVESMVYGDVLRVVHHREPLILFDVLAERGIAYRSKQLAADEWEIKLWRKS